MARPVLFVVVAVVFVVVTTYLLVKYVYPQFLEYRRDVTMAELELEKERLERDQKLVEAAEKDVYGDLDDTLDRENQGESGADRGNQGYADADRGNSATSDENSGVDREESSGSTR